MLNLPARKGQSYGTILVDLEQGKVIDLLPERDAETVAAWLQQHPGIEIVSRDRGKDYVDGVSSGAWKGRCSALSPFHPQNLPR